MLVFKAEMEGSSVWTAPCWVSHWFGIKKNLVGNVREYSELFGNIRFRNLAPCHSEWVPTPWA